MSGVNCPECYMRDGDHKMDCSVGRTTQMPMITVTEIKENEDGSATSHLGISLVLCVAGRTGTLTATGLVDVVASDKHRSQVERLMKLHP